mmetsp:Transcript_23682/g.23437  ORF Transcript_23682/g.23437 Transcript_23682/m.23437 type:complete len:279 (-) Transcript_23682:12-848(-)
MAFFTFFCIPPLVRPLYELLPYDRKVLMVTLVQIVLHEFMFILGNIMIFIIYYLKHPFFEQYKTYPESWPWEKDPVQFKAQFKHAVWNVLVNHFIVHPIMLAPYLTGNIPYRMDLETFPSCSELIMQVFFCLLAEDFTFYWAHRTLHTPKLYGLIHKQHHEYKYTIGYVAEYANPVEYAINLFATGIGPFLCGAHCHMFTIYLWYCIRTFETLDGHCGYDFPWSPFRLLPLCAGSQYHSYHHQMNIGNFGSQFIFWDTICKTNTKYWKYLSKNNAKVE